MRLGPRVQLSPRRVLEENHNGVVQQSHVDVLACLLTRLRRLWLVAHESTAQLSSRSVKILNTISCPSTP